MKKVFERGNLRLTLDSELPLTKMSRDDKRAMLEFVCNGDILASCNYWQALCGGSVGKFSLTEGDLGWLASFDDYLLGFLNYDKTEYRSKENA